MQRVSFHRRTFLAGVAAAGCASLTRADEHDHADDESPPASIRRNIASLEATGPELTKFRRAVQILKDRSARDPDDRTGWLHLTGLHNAGAGGCQHYNWWFLPWHRAYLITIERALQSAVGDESLTIPYWDWSTLQRVPDALWGSGNPLFHPGRLARQGQAFDRVELSPPVVGELLTVPDFGTFGGVFGGGGMLEAQPHNLIHNLVGGDMATVEGAARDPIFILHHANVDRLWENWLAADAGHVNVTLPQWLNQKFAFPNIDGEPTNISVADVVDPQRLNYGYDDMLPAVRAASPSARTTLADAPRTVKLEHSSGLREKLALPAQFRALDASGGVRAMQLRIEGLSVPDNPNVILRIFLNKPDATAETSINDLHYAGYVSFFGGTAHDHGDHEAHAQHKPMVLLSVTRALRRMAAARALDDRDLEVTLVPVPLRDDRAATRVEFERLRLTTIR